MVGEVFELDLVVERHGVTGVAMKRLYLVVDSEENVSGCQELSKCT